MSFFKNNIKNIFLVSFILILLFVAYLFYFSNDASPSLKIETEIWAHFGAFTSAFLLSLTILIQIRTSKRQQIEAKFFEMVRYYRDNISEMSFLNPFSKVSSTEMSSQRRVIVLIFRQYLFARNITESFLNQGKWDKDNIATESNILRKKFNASHLKYLYVSDISYQIVFWGVAKHNIDDTKQYLKKNYNEEFVEEIIKIFESIPILKSVLYGKSSKHLDLLLKNSFPKSDSINILCDIRKEFIKFQNADKSFDKFFGGHQYHLGHYFRHMFQLVKYIDSQPLLILNQKEKYEYIKTLRAQMSNYEQALFFLNSFSSMGVKWEISNENKKCFITNYNLIKNLPQQFIPKLDPQIYYPKIDYEWI